MVYTKHCTEAVVLFISTTLNEIACLFAVILDKAENQKVNVIVKQESYAISQRWPRGAPYTGMYYENRTQGLKQHLKHYKGNSRPYREKKSRWKFWGLRDYAHATF